MMGLLGGSGGIAAYVRARGQNRADASHSLTEAQNVFNQGVAAELAALRQEVRDEKAEKDKIEARLNETVKTAAVLLDRSDAQEKRIQALTAQNTEQAAQIAALTEENASTTQRLKVEIAKNEFMERENGELRRECERLKALLPVRVEVS